MKRHDGSVISWVNITLGLALWAVIFLLGTSANAQEAPTYTIGLHVGSVHSTSRDDVAGKPWNNVNPGLYLRRDNVVIGGYYNSIRKGSLYVGYVYSVTDWLDVTVGIVSGYDGPGYSAKRVMPMVVPSVHFGIVPNVTGRIHLAPQVAKGGATAVHFSIEYKFN